MTIPPFHANLRVEWWDMSSLDYLRKHCWFVLFEEPVLHYHTNGQAILGERSRHTYTQMMLRHRSRTFGTVLPRTLSGLLVVHKQCVKEFERAAGAWSKAFVGVVAQLEKDWLGVVNNAWQECLDRGALGPRNSTLRLGADLEDKRLLFEVAADEEPNYSDLVYAYCSLSAVRVAESKSVGFEGGRLELMAYDFVTKAWRLGLLGMVSELSRLAGRSEVFHYVTKEVFGKRRYLWHLKNLPIDRWLLHSGLFNDSRSTTLLLKLKERRATVLKKRTLNTQQKALVQLCEDLPSCMEELEWIGERPCPVASVLSAS